MTNLTKIPNHLAIILDGNGRFGIANFGSRNKGHKAGIENIAKIVEYTLEYKINILSLFCFSTENWSRPESEVSYLLSLADNIDKKDFKYLDDKGILVKVVGLKDKLNTYQLNLIEEVEERTKNNTNLKVNICFDYGSKTELLNVILNNKIKDIDDLSNNLWIKEDVDLLIRTGGVKRLSNFLLWQSAYAELYFSDKLFPEFDKQDFISSLEYYSNTNRRFGNIEN